MNILFILNTVTPQRGGVSMVSYIISKKMKECNYNVYYLYNHFESFPEYGTYQFYIPPQFNEIKIYKTISQICTERKINIIINQTGLSPNYIKALKRIKQSYRNIFLVTFFHSSPDFWIQQLKNPPFYLFNTKVIVSNFLKRIIYTIHNKHKKNIEDLYSISDKFILLSKSFIPEFLRIYNTKNNNKLDFINNPCTLFKQNNNFTYNKKNQVLVVGRLSEKQKRISIIIRIWKQIEKKHPDWSLILVGNGPNKNDYEKLATKYNLKNIKFEGQKANTEKYYQESKIFLMTSIWEGWGLTLVESLYYNCVPILFSNFSACYDIIQNDENGILIPNNDKNLFAQKLNELIENPEKLGYLSQNGNESVKKFDIDNIYEIWQKKILGEYIKIQL